MMPTMTDTIERPEVTEAQPELLHRAIVLSALSEAAVRIYLPADHRILATRSLRHSMEYLVEGPGLPAYDPDRGEPTQLTIYPAAKIDRDTGQVSMTACWHDRLHKPVGEEWHVKTWATPGDMQLELDEANRL